MANFRERCVEALAGRLREIAGEGAFLPDKPGYVADIDAVLIPGVRLEWFEADLRQGAGNELDWKDGRPPKFHAAHSSSALAVNAFAPWKQSPGEMSFAGVRGFERLAFEYRCPHGLAGRTPPNLDVAAFRPGMVIAIESKCTEYLSPKTAKFADAYAAVIERLAEPGWAEVYLLLKDDPRHFRHLDAAQLLKHYLGLRHTHADDEAILGYVYWEPRNASDFETCRRHRAEMEEFATRVRGSAVRVVARSYTELFDEWGHAEGPVWLAGHLAHLHRRYDLEVSI